MRNILKTYVLILLFLILSVLISSVTSAADKNSGDEIGSYKGVKAYSNGSYTRKSTGEKIDYQCLAYVQRFYERHYFPLGRWGSARNFWNGLYEGRDRDRELSRLKKVGNDGKSRPQPDDIVYFDVGSDGHVAIVTGVSGDNVEVIEQNWSRNTAYRTVKLSQITGWLTTKSPAQTLSPGKLPLSGYRDGVLLKGSRPEVYVIQGGRKCWIPDPATFKAMGYDWNKIVVIPDGELERIPRGPDIPRRR